MNGIRLHYAGEDQGRKIADMIIKANIAVIMLGATFLGIGMVVNFVQGIGSNATNASPALSLAAAALPTAEESKYTPAELLVKFKAGITDADRQKAISGALSEPQEILVDPSTGMRVQPVDPNAQQKTPSTAQTQTSQKKLLHVTLQSAKNALSTNALQKTPLQQGASQKITDVGLNRWTTLHFSTSDIGDQSAIDVFQIQKKLLASGNVEYAQPNYILSATLTPNDPYFASSGSWGQLYDDQWSVKTISAPRAWDVIYAKRGDLNKDGKITQDDVNLLIKYTFQNAPAPDPVEVTDVNGDGVTDVLDVVYLANTVNGDGPAPIDYSKNKVIIAVSDTGVDYTHEDIRNNIWRNTGEIAGNGIDDDHNGYVDDVMGWDFTTCAAFAPYSCAVSKNPGPDPKDNFGHGTHVAGIIAAEFNNGKGIAGVCPHCTIMSVKGLNAQGSGYTSELADTLVYAANNGANIINMSWGGYSPSAEYPFLEDVVAYVHSLGVVLVAAAGNSNAPAQAFAPAQFQNVITVGALDHQDVKSSFSNWGKIDVTAPGGDSGVVTMNGDQERSPFVSRNILSLQASGLDMYRDGLSIVGGGYYRARGTSMASPFVSGVAGLVKARHPEFTPEQVRAALEESATDLSHASYDCGTVVSKSSCSLQPTCYWYTPCGTYDIYECAMDSTCYVDSGTKTCTSNAGVCKSWDVQYGTGWDKYTGSGKVDAYRALMVSDPLVSHIENPAQTGYYTRGNQTISGSAYGKNFSRYRVSYASENDPSNWTVITESQTPVTLGVLATWDTSALMGNYFVKLTVIDSAGREVSDSREVLTGLVAGWPVRFYDRSESHINPDDIDKDGKAEIILGSYQNLQVWNDDGTPATAQPFQALRNPYGMVTGDLNGDGYKEIVFGTLEGTKGIHVVDYTGAEITNGWPKLIESSVKGPVIADLDLDGKPEVISVDKYPKQIEAWHGDGSSLAHWPVSLPDTAYLLDTTIAVGDVDNDGKPEVVAVDATGSTYQREIFIIGNDGTMKKSWVVADGDTRNTTGLVLADINGDGALEIIITGWNTLSIYRYTGELIATVPLGLSGGNIAIGDINADGTPEIVADSRDHLNAWDAAGHMLAGWPLELWGIHSPVIGDVNGDGAPEIVAVDGSSVHAFSAQGKEIAGYPIYIGNLGSYLEVALKDINSDGHLDMVVYGNSYEPAPLVKILAFDLPRTARNASWPRYQYDNGHSGVYAQCADQTVFGQCNVSKQVCNNGKLTSDCRKCGFTCLAGTSCTADGSCVASVTPICRKVGLKTVCTLPDSSSL